MGCKGNSDKIYYVFCNIKCFWSSSLWICFYVYFFSMHEVFCISFTSASLQRRSPKLHLSKTLYFSLIFEGFTKLYVYIPFQSFKYVITVSCLPPKQNPLFLRMPCTYMMEYHYLYFYFPIPNCLTSLSRKPPSVYVFLFYGDADVVYLVPHCVLAIPYGSAVDIAQFLGKKEHSLLSLQFLVGFQHTNRELQSFLMTSILVLQACNVMVQHSIFYFVCVTMKMSGAVFTLLTPLGIQSFLNLYVNISDQLGAFAITIAFSIHSPFPGHLLSYLQYFFQCLYKAQIFH